MRFSLLVSLLTGLSFASNAYAATLNVVDGQLMGASNVLVDGSLYDVQFLDGTCIDLYNGCNAPSDFTFQSAATATLASHALLAQVFLDGPSGAFDRVVHLINGCESLPPCHAATPWWPQPYEMHHIAFSLANNHNDLYQADTTTMEYAEHALSLALVLLGVSSDQLPAHTYAVWQPALIPEPSTSLLVSLGLVGLAGKGRRRNRS